MFALGCIASVPVFVRAFAPMLCLSAVVSAITLILILMLRGGKS